MQLTHTELVCVLLRWLEENCELDSSLLFVDDAGFQAEQSPAIGSSVPDVYVKWFVPDREIICEAKTEDDLFTRRSAKQLNDYIQYIKHRPRATLILCTEAGAEGAAKKVVFPILDRHGVLPEKVIYVCP